jgi:hypothetical protein
LGIRQFHTGWAFFRKAVLRTLMRIHWSSRVLRLEFTLSIEEQVPAFLAEACAPCSLAE